MPKSNALLYIVTGDSAGKSYILPLDDRKFMIGRRADCDLVIPHSFVSREQGFIQSDGDRYVVHPHTDALNPLHLNAMPITSPQVLEHGDELSVEQFAIEFVSLRAPDAADLDTASLMNFAVKRKQLPTGKFTEGNSLIGAVVDDKYRILCALGEGGTAVVYKARALSTGTIVALKYLKRQAGADPKVIRRFKSEFDTSSELHHPNLVHALDFDQWQDSFYLVTEYLRGSALRDIIKDRGPLPQAAVVSIGAQVAAGLEHAHLHGVVHRDVTPANIVVSFDGRVKLLDLGLAKSIKDQMVGHITGDFQAIGTLPFMPREQLLNTKFVDERGDVYSLGMVLYFAIFGRLPFPSDDLDRLRNDIMRGHIAPPPPAIAATLHPGLLPILLKAIAADPDERWPSAGSLRRELEQLSEKLAAG